MLVVDGRGERASHLAGHARADGSLEVLAASALPHSLGLLYEELTEHLGFRRSSDEYKVMAMASYGSPRFLDALRELVRPSGDGGFTVEPDRLGGASPRALERRRGLDAAHADLACSVQTPPRGGAARPWRAGCTARRASRR